MSAMKRRIEELEAAVKLQEQRLRAECETAKALMSRLNNALLIIGHFVHENGGQISIPKDMLVADDHSSLEFTVEDELVIVRRISPDDAQKIIDRRQPDVT